MEVMNEDRKSFSAALLMFEDFTEDEFCEWIDSLLGALRADPTLSIAPLSPRLELGAEEIDGILIGLYKSLRRSRGYFADAIAMLYESTSYIEGHAERIYLLLQLIAVIKPRRARNLLRGHLLDEIALSIEIPPIENEEHLQRHFGVNPKNETRS